MLYYNKMITYGTVDAVLYGTVLNGTVDAVGEVSAAFEKKTMITVSFLCSA